MNDLISRLRLRGNRIAAVGRGEWPDQDDDPHAELCDAARDVLDAADALKQAQPVVDAAIKYRIEWNRDPGNSEDTYDAMTALCDAVATYVSNRGQSAGDSGDLNTRVPAEAKSPPAAGDTPDEGAQPDAEPGAHEDDMMSCESCHEVFPLGDLFWNRESGWYICQGCNDSGTVEDSI